jgi:hypothetical protein
MKRIKPAPTNAELCRVLLEKLRWPNGTRCPKCGGKEIIRVVDGSVFACRCQYKFTVFSGTAMHDSRLPAETWCKAVLLFAEDPRITARRLSQKLGVSYKTAWSLRGRILTNANGLTCESVTMFEDTLAALLRGEPTTFNELVESGREG